MNKLEHIKEQARGLLADGSRLQATKLASLVRPPVSNTAMAIALNQLHEEGVVTHITGQGWTLIQSGGRNNASAA